MTPAVGYSLFFLIFDIWQISLRSMTWRLSAFIRGQSMIFRFFSERSRIGAE